MGKDKEDVKKFTGFSETDLVSLEKMSMVDLGRTMGIVREELDRAASIKTMFEHQYDTLKRMLPKKMESEGVERFTVDGRGIAVRVEVYASIPADKREEAYLWLRKNGLGSVITNTVNGSTLKAMVKEQVSLGHTLPDDLFKVTMEPQARFY